MKDINKDIELDFNNRKPIDKKALKKEIKQIEKSIKKLAKSEKIPDKILVRKKKDELKEAKTSLTGRITVNVDGKRFKIKETYFDRIKDKEKYIRNLHRRSTEREIGKLSSEVVSESSKVSIKKLQSLTKKYSKTYSQDTGYKSGVVKAVKSQIKVQASVNPFVDRQEFIDIIDYDDYDFEGDEDGDSDDMYAPVVSINTSGRTMTYTNI